MTIERGQAVAARESRAVGIHWAFAPMVDIARDPRWGRIIEGAGEDPYLASAVAVAQVRGFQGAALGASERVIAGPKHLAGYGAAIGGRDYDEVNLSDSELWNVVLAPRSRPPSSAGAGNIMTGLHGPQRHPGHRQSVAVHRCAARRPGGSRASWSATPTPCAICTPTASPPTSPTRRLGPQAGVDLEMAVGDPAYAHLPEAAGPGR